MIDAAKLSGIDGVKYLCSVPAGENVVAMEAHKGSIYIATNRNVYRLVDDKRLELIVQPSEG